MGNLDNDTYEFIKGEAVHLLVECDIKCFHLLGFEIATRMHIKLAPYSSLNENELKGAMKISTDGVFAERNGEETIYYNDLSVSQTRQNWTILHELGHIFLDHTGNEEYAEEEANFFAKYISAPPIIIYSLGLNHTEEVADIFGLGYEAAYYALDYYSKWRRKYKKTKRLEKYELDLLNLYKTVA